MRDNDTDGSDAAGGGLDSGGSATSSEPVYSSELSEALELATRIAAGDADAENQMVRLYEPGMRRILRTRTDGPSDIDDLVNQVWMLALPKLRRGELRDPRALPAYLNTFTRRVARNYLRHSSRKAGTTDTEFIERQESPTEGPYARLKWTQAVEIATTLLDDLSVDRDREILERYLVEGEDKDRICEDLELDPVQFNKVLHRARKRFKELAREKLVDLINAEPA